MMVLDPDLQDPIEGNPVRTFRKILASAGIASVAFTGVGLLTAAPASASSAYPNGTVTATAECNFDSHRMDMEGTVQLSDRFSGGAWVASRSVYWRINPATRQRISTVGSTDWQLSWVQPAVDPNASTLEGNVDFFAGQSSAVPTVTVDQLGQLQVMLQVAVWNGAAFEFLGVDTVSTYDNYSQYGYYSQNSYCAASKF